MLKCKKLIDKRAEELGYSYGRREGNTTRAVDYYIQKLFKNGKLVFEIPTEDTLIGYRDDEEFAYDFPLDIPNVQRFLFTKVVNRLRFEHEHLFYPIKRSNGEWENQISITPRRIKLLKQLVG